MSNDFLSRVLGSVLGGGAGGRQGLPGGLDSVLGQLGGGGSGGGLSGLGGMLGGGGGGPGSQRQGDSPLGGKGALIAMLLPLAMQWVQRNGGLGAVLGRFRQQGLTQHFASDRELVLVPYGNYPRVIRKLAVDKL